MQPVWGQHAHTDLHGATVTLLSGLQEGVPAHRPSVDAIGGRGAQQTGRVHLLQEAAELLLTAAAEQLRIHESGGRRRRREEEVNVRRIEEEVDVRGV